MTGKQLKQIRKKSGLGVKKFYEKKLGFTFYTAGLSLEKFATIPDVNVEKIKKAGLLDEK